MKWTAEFNITKAVAIAVFLSSSTAFASFEPLPVGGRAAGMAEAYSAVVDDVFSLYYNPAGVMQVTRPEVGTYYSQLYPGLTDSSKISRMFLGYAQPLGEKGRLGGIGASYMSLQLAGLDKEEAFGQTYGGERKHRHGDALDRPAHGDGEPLQRGVTGLDHPLGEDRGLDRLAEDRVRRQEEHPRNLVRHHAALHRGARQDGAAEQHAG